MKRLITLLLALFIAFGLLASCGQGNSEATPTPASATPTAANTPTSGQPEDPEDEVFSWPLASPTTFDIWYGGTLSPTAGMITLNDSAAYQEAEKRTNVHIEWSVPAQGMANEQFNLIVASNIYPDAFFGGSYIGGHDRFIDNGITIDLRPLLEEYAPSWTRMASIDEVTWKKNLTDMGRVPGFYNISYEVEPTWQGPLMREDWLKEFGMEAPQTFDQWHDYLTRAKNEKGCDRGYMYRISTTSVLDDVLLLGYDLKAGFFARNGEVCNGAYEDAFLDYLTMVSQWFSEGLIDADFASRATSYTADTGFFLRNEAAAWQSTWSNIDLHKSQAEDQNFQNVAVVVPTREVGQTRKMTISYVPDSRVGTAIDTITSQCDDPVTLVRWFDYFYSDEGELLADYGLEGQGFNYVGGKPVLAELITKNPDGMTMNDCLAKYTIPTAHSRQYDWARQRTGRSDYALNSVMIWDSNWDKEAGYTSMQGVTLTEQESAEYTPLMNDIDTYISEAVTGFITGAKPLSDFEAFRAQLKTMSIERCLELYQAAYDRYLSR